MSAIRFFNHITPTLSQYFLIITSFQHFLSIVVCICEMVSINENEQNKKETLGLTMSRMKMRVAKKLEHWELAQVCHPT